MKSVETFYSWNYLACINYTGDLYGGFKLIELKADFEHTLKKFRTDYYIFFILSGELEVTTRESRHWSIKKGQLSLLTEGYKIKCQSPVVLICYTSDLPGNNGNRLLKQLGHMSEKIEGLGEPINAQPALESFFDLLKIYLTDGIACGHLQEQKQEEFFALLGEYYTVFELGNLFAPILNDKDLEFRKLVDSHYLYASTVVELCALCGFKPEEFRKQFQKVYGMPVYRWMQLQKLKQVKYRLQDMNLSYKELAYELGFASISHLNKFSKKWLGMSPSQYQEQLREGKDCVME